jgi:glycosyltransferase involved in cell wall biosynthesis
MKRVIGFYTDGLPFDGDALEKGPLGGSETAFIEMTRAFARLGHEVTALNNCSQPGLHHGVQYYPFRSSLSYLAHKVFDLIVVSRYYGFFYLPIKSDLKILWNHDTLENAKGLRSVHDEIDLFLVLSKFHQSNYLTRLPQLDDRTVVTRNGLNFKLLDNSTQGAQTDPHKLLYASRPERGLKLLLEEIWPRLSQNRPDLRLYICGYSVDPSQLAPELIGLYDYLNLLIKTDPKIINLGPLDKKSYYRHLAESAMVTYPCIFPEISCLVALEAQALGVPILTSDSYALSETVVTPDFKISGRPGSPDYTKNYIERTLKLLAHPEEMQEKAQKGKQIIRENYSWDQIAGEWQRTFELSLKSKKNFSPFISSTETNKDAYLA